MFDSASNEEMADKIYQEFLDNCREQLEAIELDGSFAQTFLDMVSSYTDVDLLNFSTESVEEILFYWMPKKFSIAPDFAAAIIAELRILFLYLTEKYKLEHGASILKLLNEAGIAEELRDALADTSKYGIAKSMVMSAMDLGYDVSDPEDMNEFVALHNAQMARRYAPDEVDADAKQMFTRLDDGHQPHPSPPKSPMRSPAEQKKFNKDRQKALAKKKRK